MAHEAEVTFQGLAYCLFSGTAFYQAATECASVMRRKKVMMRLFGVSILTIATALASFAQTHNGQAIAKAEKEVISFLDALTEAGLKRDAATLDRLYSDDYFHTNPDGSIMTKAQVLDSYRAAPKSVIESNQHDEDKVWLHGDVAFINTRMTIKGRVNQGPYVQHYRVTYIFEKMKSGWRAVNSHASLILQSAK